MTEQLGVFIEAARRRGKALDLLLLYSPPGLGKTSLAHHRRQLNADGAAVDPGAGAKADIAAFSTALEPGSVFLSTRFTASAGRWRTCYPAMEDRRLPVVLGQETGARTVTLDLPAFTP